jgi:glucoamylase
MARARAALAIFAAGAVGLLLVSGGDGADPRTPPALPGLPAPFHGTALVGGGRLTAAIDAYGNLVDLRAAPAGPALIDNPYERQLAGTVAADTGIVPRLSVEGGPALPLWRADTVSQRYLPGTNVVRTTARFGAVAVAVTDAARGAGLARIVEVSAPRGTVAIPSVGVNLEPGAVCEREHGPGWVALVCGADPEERTPRLPEAHLRTGRRDSESVRERAAFGIRAAAGADRAWLRRARPLGGGDPAWARRLYQRSLLVLRALTDRRGGAVAAGARGNWAYVWPRDAGTVAAALAAAGYRAEARRVARFLLRLDLDAAARFHGDGRPVEGRAAQGDAVGWVSVALDAAGLRGSRGRVSQELAATHPSPWRGLADYREGDPGDYLANAIAATVDGPETLPNAAKSARRDSAVEFETPRGLVRVEGEPDSGLDAAAAWAARPFPHPTLYPAVRETLLRLAAGGTRFGVTPGEGWTGIDPWSAPTAWSAWSLAALGERRAALGLLADLRRAATPAGDLPERVDVLTGVPRSTTPLAWSHAFAILALRQLWPRARQ